jgi:hypothetical protein
MPFTRHHALLFCAVCSFSVAGFAQSKKKVPFELARVELSDGREFTDMRVRTYDARSDKVLILTDGKAMALPLALFPPSLHELLKSAPPSGGSVSTTPAASQQPRPMAMVADQYATETTIPASLPPPVHVVQRAPRRVEPAREASPIGHQFAARARATRHYRYEYQAGSNSISVTALDFEFSTPEPIPGWTGRCRTEGKAYLEFYDSKGRSFQRATSTFEVVTEQKSGEELKVIDFTRKT